MNSAPTHETLLGLSNEIASAVRGLMLDNGVHVLENGLVKDFGVACFLRADGRLEIRIYSSWPGVTADVKAIAIGYMRAAYDLDSLDGRHLKLQGKLCWPTFFSYGGHDGWARGFVCTMPVELDLGKAA